MVSGDAIQMQTRARLLGNFEGHWGTPPVRHCQAGHRSSAGREARRAASQSTYEPLVRN
jgi:hypothetical protein